MFGEFARTSGLSSSRVDLGESDCFVKLNIKQAMIALQGMADDKNVNVTTIMFLMSGDLTGLCLYMEYDNI